MKTASLALAAAVATIVASAQPVAAQTQDRTGAATSDQATPDTDAMTGRDGADDNGHWRGDRNDSAADSGESGRRWSERGPMAMPMRPALPHRRMMMLQGAGAQFHFARGRARIDVTCSPQEDTEACVRAAGLLIDKIAELHGANHDDMTGSAGGDDGRPGAQREDRDDSGALRERM